MNSYKKRQRASMKSTQWPRESTNNMNTEIDKSDCPENAICIQTSNIETNDMNGQCHNGQTESTNDKEDNLVYRCPICRKRPSPVMNVMNGITTAVLRYHN